MKLLFILATTLLIGCYDSFETPDNHATTPPVNTTLRELRARYAGTTFEITSDVVVSGYVTSSDKASNFYRSLILTDQHAALELMAGIDDLYNIYPPGYQLTLNLKGLALGQSHGTLQVGRMPPPYSPYATDYIGSKPALDRVVIRGAERLLIAPIHIDIPALTPDLCGMLVQISDLQYTPTEIDELSWAGDKQFTDRHGNNLSVYTRAYARFASYIVPTQIVTLTGILQYDAPNHYTLKLRDEHDCTY